MFDSGEVGRVIKKRMFMFMCKRYLTFREKKIFYKPVFQKSKTFTDWESFI